MDQVNEKTTYVVRLSFKDEDGIAVVPESLTYRLDDESSGEELLEDTTIVPVTTYHDVIISSDSNVILNDDKKWENKILTASFTYDTSKVGTAEHKYRVLNLSKMS